MHFHVPPNFTQLFTLVCIYYMVYGGVWREFARPSSTDIDRNGAIYHVVANHTPEI